MKYLIDIHTHTISSGHAYSTLLENVNIAAERGLEVLGIADHAPTMPGGPHIYHIANLKMVPRTIQGVFILRSCEANILDFDGNIDVPERIQNNLDIMIASLHEPVIKPGTIEENTRALLKVMDNPNVHIIGHPGNPAFPIDVEVVIKKAKEKDIMIELNNSSFGPSRPGSSDTCIKIAKLCKEIGTKIMVGSDAHICFQIGDFADVDAVLKDIEMPEELIMNLSKEKLFSYLKSKNKLKDIEI